VRRRAAVGPVVESELVPPDVCGVTAPMLRIMPTTLGIVWGAVERSSVEQELEADRIRGERDARRARIDVARSPCA
jgi:hypothetical protein